jgi:hypothetical protein
MITTHVFLASLLCSIWLLGSRPPGSGGTRLTLTPSLIPNSNYVIMVSDLNCLKYLCMFFCAVILRCTDTHFSPCIYSIYTYIWSNTTFTQRCPVQNQTPAHRTDRPQHNLSPIPSFSTCYHPTVFLRHHCPIALLFPKGENGVYFNNAFIQVPLLFVGLCKSEIA